MQQELPLVSIVTPSLNQGRFIEETILSIKNQTYPQIEHIIIDGDSSDNSLDIIKKYEGTYNMQWISESDKGQSDAINKGWRMSKGEILAYLNADDTYMPWAVETAVKFLNDHPDVIMVYGDCNLTNECSEVVGVVGGYSARDFDLKGILCRGNMVPQPAVFFRRRVLDEVGYLDANLYMAMDYDLWIRIGLKFRVKHIPQFLASYRLHPGTKSADEGYKFGYDNLYIVNKLFSNSELPREVMALKRQAYSYGHLRAGVGYHYQRQMELARKHLIKSIMLYPPNLLRPWVAGYLVTSLLGRVVTDIVVRWKRKLIDKRSL